jgi:hypothetical protein
MKMEYILYWNALPIEPKTFDIFTFFVKRCLDKDILIDEINGFEAHDTAHKDSFTISEIDEGFRFCRTKSLAFTKNVMRSLIFMRELGMVNDISSNQELDFLAALDDVNKVIALNSYDVQKSYFLTLDPLN